MSGGHRHRVIVHALEVGVIAALLTAASSFPSLGAIELDHVSFAVGKDHVDGAASIGPYYLDVTIVGRGIADIQITSPQSCSFFMDQVAEETWWIEADGFGSLFEMRNDPCLGFGSFVIDLFGTTGDQDSVTVAFDPGNVDLVTGYGSVTSPTHNQTGVSQEPAMAWTCSGTCGTAGWDLEVVYDSDWSWARSAFLPVSLFTWSPDPLEPQTVFQFWVHSAEFVDTGRDPMTTTGGDAFIYERLFETLNRILFTTEERIVLFVQPGQLDWTFLSSAVSYDIVRGDLVGLHASGDLTATTEQCVANNYAPTSLPYSIDPSPGQAHWLLARGVMTGGPATYDTLVSSQAGPRDAAVSASPSACP